MTKTKKKVTKKKNREAMSAYAFRIPKEVMEAFDAYAERLGRRLGLALNRSMAVRHLLDMIARRRRG